MRTFLLFTFLIVFSAGFAQSDVLAKNYFEQGEYEKALSVYEKLNKQNPYRLDYFMGVIEANQQLENFSEAELLLKQKIGNGANFPQLYVELGYNFSLQNKEIQANENYGKAIEAISQNPNFAYNVGNTFEKYSLLDEAVTTYEKAMQLNPKNGFQHAVGEYLWRTGKA